MIYQKDSSKAEEFIHHEEILDTLEYAQNIVKSINDTIKRLKDDNKMDGYMQEALKLAEK